MRARGMLWMGVAGVVLMLGIAACSDSGKAIEESLDESPIIGEPELVVAEVNGAGITLGEVNRVVNAYRTGQIFNADPSVPEGSLQRQAVNELVGQRLLFEEAKRAGMGISDEEVQAFLDRERTQFPSPQAFQDALSQLGLTEQSLADGFRRDMAVREFIDESVRSRLSVSVEEAKVFYDENPQNFIRPEQVHGRHILIRVPEDSGEDFDQEALKKIEAIAKRIRGGEDFAKIARAESDDPGSGSRGGDLGFYRQGQMVPPFDSVSFTIPIGVLSDPVKTAFGYHLIEVIEKQGPQTVPFDEIESRLVNGLLGQKTQEEVESLISSLKKRAKIKKSY